MEAAQQEQLRREVEAARKPLHEEMRDKAAELTAIMQQLQPGDPRAVNVIRGCFLGLLEIMDYVLEREAQDGNDHQFQRGGNDCQRLYP